MISPRPSSSRASRWSSDNDFPISRAGISRPRKVGKTKGRSIRRRRMHGSTRGLVHWWNEIYSKREKRIVGGKKEGIKKFHVGDGRVEREKDSLALFVLVKGGRERTFFFSLSLSPTSSTFSRFSCRRWGRRTQNAFEFFLLSIPPPPPPGKTRRSREKYFILVRDWRCALDRLQKGRNEQGQLKKTQERDFYICVALDLAILFVQSAFPIVILLVTKRNESVNTVNAFLGIQGSRWRESSRSSSHRRSRFDARDEQLDLFVVRICPTVRLTLPPPPYCTFKKILSKFCSSDILIF